MKRSKQHKFDKHYRQRKMMDKAVAFLRANTFAEYQPIFLRESASSRVIKFAVRQERWA